MIRKQFVLTSLSAIALAGALTSCADAGSHSGDSPIGAVNTPVSAHPAQPQKNSIPPINSSSAPTPPNSAGTFTAAKTALATAQAAVGGFVTELDFHSRERTWLVTVCAADKRTETDFEISPDGKKVLQQNSKIVRANSEPDLRAAKITLTQALTALEPEFEGYIGDADLQQVGGKLMWKISVITEKDRVQSRVLVDAETGERS